MKTKEILAQKVNIYRPEINKDKDNKLEYNYHYTTTLINFLQKTCQNYKYKVEYVRKLNKTDEAAAKDYKLKNLCGATISATFNKRRIVGDVKERTGVISIDIDNIKEEDIEKVKQDVMKLPFVFLTMRSCRNGVFCLVYYNKHKQIKYIFNSLREEFIKLGYIIDRNCSDITRLRYVSYDNNILIKPDVEMYDKTLEDEAREFDPEGDWVLSKQDITDIVVCVYVLVNYNNYTSDEYDEWLLDGFRLATIPNKEVGYKLFEMISQESANYKGPDDVREKFEECWRTTTYTTHILGYYINKVKEIYGQDWKFRVSDLLLEKGIKIKI